MNSWDLPIKNLAKYHPFKLGIVYFFCLNGVVLLINHLISFINKSEADFGMVIVIAISQAFGAAIIVSAIRKKKPHV